jgi:ribosomal protein S18 acetylase RimI-like enzyme
MMVEMTSEAETESVVTVRPAVRADALGLAEVNILGWQAAYRGILPDAYLDGLSRDWDDAVARWRANVSDIEGSGRSCWVAVSESGKVIGFVVCGPNRDEVAEPGVGELWAIYVHPTEWRTGTGSILMEVAIEQLASDGYDEAILWVFERNKRARAFYERHGWRHDGASSIFERGGGQAIEFRYRRSLRLGS